MNFCPLGISNKIFCVNCGGVCVERFLRNIILKMCKCYSDERSTLPGMVMGKKYIAVPGYLRVTYW